MIGYDVEKISKRIENKRKCIKILKISLLVILIILFIVCTIMMSIDRNEKLDGDKFAIYAFDIISESMMPTFNIGDIIIVKKINESNELKLNDIITFEHDEKIISHRILRIENDGEQDLFYTKGDNNEEIDDFFIKNHQIYGKVILIIPKLGYITRHLHEKYILLQIILLIIIIFAIFNIKQDKKIKRKKLRKKYDINNIKRKR